MVFIYTRELTYQNNSFFLFGPRGVGKSTWLKQTFPNAAVIDLLLTNTYLEYIQNPGLLLAKVRVLPKDAWIVLDEIQRVPELLNVVHYLMENDGYKNFVLTGSSARKLKRASANMLAGRALMKKMFVLNSKETEFSIPVEQQIKFGMLPMSVSAASDELREGFLSSYVATYLNEEIKAEGIVRNLGTFSRFLEVAALSAGTQVNVSGIARDVEINRETVRGYFSVFEDTLLGSWLPAYYTRLKAREAVKPKFYWLGVLNMAAGGFKQPLARDWDGILFEHLVHNELSSYLYYNNIKGELGFWKGEGGSKIDFIWWYGDKIVAIEVKLAKKFKREFLKGFKAFPKSVQSRYVVYLGDDELLVDDTHILPYQKFCRELHGGNIIAL